MRFEPIRWIAPRGLFGRSLLLIVVPLIALQAVVTWVFFDRLYDIMASRLARAVATDIALTLRMARLAETPEERRAVLAAADRTLGATVRVMEGESLPGQRPQDRSILDAALGAALTQSVRERTWYDTGTYPDWIDIRVSSADGVVRFLIPRKRLHVSNVDIFVIWMVAASVVLTVIAMLFLRNQVRAIARLAAAAEAFGRGRDVEAFKPSGATEVRRAGLAFLDMRARIARHIQQRTEMLAGVSHDLKTPLTRIKLQLAVMEPSPDVEALAEDVQDMEHMLDEYLAFARGQQGEQPSRIDLASLAREAAEDARRSRRPGRAQEIGLDIPQTEDFAFEGRAGALKRCLANLVDNATKHGRTVRLALQRGARWIEIAVEDDGPGIPADQREEAFRPFRRLDQGRNLQAGGVGLGLTIARDAARSHGGELHLEDSALGGLRAVIRLPV